MTSRGGRTGQKEHAMLRHATLGFAAAALVSATLIPDAARAHHRHHHRATRHWGCAGAAVLGAKPFTFHEHIGSGLDYRGDCYRAAGGMLVCPRWPY